MGNEPPRRCVDSVSNAEVDDARTCRPQTDEYYYVGWVVPQATTTNALFAQTQGQSVVSGVLRPHDLVLGVSGLSHHNVPGRHNVPEFRVRASHRRRCWSNGCCVQARPWPGHACACVYERASVRACARAVRSISVSNNHAPIQHAAATTANNRHAGGFFPKPVRMYARTHTQTYMVG